MASHQEIRRRSSAADRTTVESSVFAAASTLTPPDKSSPPTTAAPDSTDYNHDVTTRSRQKLKRLSGSDTRTMPPPPLPAEHITTPSSSLARHSCSSDSAARIPNRLSLTLPIALPNSDPSRPTPSASASTPSPVPPTPQDGSAMPSPSNVNEFIIAIAAKERKVMELKEELAREETELAMLKKQFSSTDALHRRGGASQLELGGSRTATPTAPESDALSPRRSVDFDRRAQFLQNQGTPTQSRRRVMRGGHTRALSLLSPTKATSDFSILDEHTATATNDARFPLAANRTHHAPNPALLKRASWQPRSQQDSPVVPQIVEDFKLGLRAFVEDIRQITIGDEPISGQSSQRSLHTGHYRSGSLSQGVYTDVGRSRSGQQRGSSSSETPSTAPPTPISKRRDAPLEKPKPAKSKHFSWTPLGFDSMDDTDWANWESPVPVKSTRWSGSTIHSGVMDDIHCIPENAEEVTNLTPIKTKPTVETPKVSPNKLEDLLPNVVNRLSPSNIKRTANNLLDEWEKSLVAPSEARVANKENTAT